MLTKLKENILAENILAENNEVLPVAKKSAVVRPNIDHLIKRIMSERRKEKKKNLLILLVIFFAVVGLMTIYTAQ